MKDNIMKNLLFHPNNYNSFWLLERLFFLFMASFTFFQTLAAYKFPAYVIKVPYWNYIPDYAFVYIMPAILIFYMLFSPLILATFFTNNNTIYYWARFIAFFHFFAWTMHLFIQLFFSFTGYGETLLDAKVKVIQKELEIKAIEAGVDPVRAPAVVGVTFPAEEVRKSIYGTTSEKAKEVFTTVFNMAKDNWPSIKDGMISAKDSATATGKEVWVILKDGAPVVIEVAKNTIIPMAEATYIVGKTGLKAVWAAWCALDHWWSKKPKPEENNNSQAQEGANASQNNSNAINNVLPASTNALANQNNANLPNTQSQNNAPIGPDANNTSVGFFMGSLSKVYNGAMFESK